MARSGPHADASWLSDTLDQLDTDSLMGLAPAYAVEDLARLGAALVADAQSALARLRTGSGQGRARRCSWAAGTTD